jgi:hypothetical protein
MRTRLDVTLDAQYLSCVVCLYLNTLSELYIYINPNCIPLIGKNVERQVVSHFSNRATTLEKMQKTMTNLRITDS